MTSGSAPVEVGKHGVIGVSDDDDGALESGRSPYCSVRLDGDDAAVADSLPVVPPLPQLRVAPPGVDGPGVNP